jgi:hypothetical protein
MTATKERRSPDRRFEFRAKGAAFRRNLGQPRKLSGLKARFNWWLICLSLVTALEPELIRAFSARYSNDDRSPGAMLQANL